MWRDKKSQKVCIREKPCPVSAKSQTFPYMLKTESYSFPLLWESDTTAPPNNKNTKHPLPRMQTIDLLISRPVDCKIDM